MQYLLPFTNPVEFLKKRLENHKIILSDIKLTNNRTSILSVKTRYNKVNLRIHNSFVNASDSVIKAVSEFITGKTKANNNIIEEYFNEHVVERNNNPPKRKIKIIHHGDYHNIKEIYNDINEKFFSNTIEADITWGNFRPRTRKRFSRTRHITLGQYSDNDKLIIIHPNLDKKLIPRFLLEAIIYHEMCHQVTGDKKVGKRRQIHTKDFKELEKFYPHSNQAKKWERDNFEYILRSKSRK